MPLPRSVSVSRVERSAAAKQVSFGASSSDAMPRRALSNLRPGATPQARPPASSRSSRHLSDATSLPGRSQSTGRAVSEPGNFSLDYDDPEEVTRAILRLREQREREAAERSASRSRQGHRRTRERPPETIPTNAMRQKQLQQLQQALAIQTSNSQGSGSQRDRSTPEPRQTTAQLYRSPSPSLAQRHTQAITVAQSLSLPSSSSGEQAPQYTSHHRPSSNLRASQPTPRITNAPTQRHASHGPPVHRTNPTSPTMLDPNGEYEPRSTQHGPALQQAEKRIDGLLAELEEIRFFRELDGEDDAENGSSTQGLTMGIPPPPPPTTSHKPPPTTPVMDPRRISQLDRHSLELETQTLMRSVQLLTNEKLALQAEIQVLTTDQTLNKQRIQQLEQLLGQVKQQLLQARKDMEALRVTVVQQYEHRLSENVEKLQQTQKQVDGLKDDRESLRADLDRRMTQLNELKHRSKVELREEKEAAQAREAVLELQLAEVIHTVEELKLKIKNKDEELEDLRQQVQEARKTLAHAKKQQEASHQVQLQSLHEQVAGAESRYERALNERDQVQEHLRTREQQIETLKKQVEEQAAVIADLTERLEAAHTDYRQKCADLKDSFEAKEKRRLNEMVSSQSKQVEEYERRILSMQQQLTMATDRHHAEIRQKDIEIENKMERERKRAREQVEDEYRRVTERLQLDLETTKRDYEEAETDRLRLREALAAPSKEHVEAMKTWEDRDARQQQEIKRLRQQVERLTHESSDKESKILDLTLKLSDRSKKHEEQLQKMESQHAADLLARDEVIAEQKRKLRESDLNAQNERSKLESEIATTKSLMETRIAELEATLLQTNNLLEQSKADLQKAESTCQELASATLSLEKVKSELESERLLHEGLQTKSRAEIASFEAKLQSNEAILKEKVTIIGELRLAMERESESHTTRLQEVRKERDMLSQKLNDNQLQLAKERTKVEDITTKLSQVDSEKKELQEKIETVQCRSDKLSESLDLLRRTVDDLERANRDLTTSSSAALQRSQQEFEHEKATLQSRITELETNEKILRQENDELQDSCDAIEANIRKLRIVNEELEAKASEVPKLLSDKSLLQEKLARKEDELIQTNIEMRRIEQELGEVKRNLDDYESRLNETNFLTTDLEKQAKQATQVSDRYASTAKELQAKVDSLEADKSMLKSDIESLKVDLLQKDEEASELQKKVDQLSTERDTVRELHDKLKSELDLKTKRVSELEQKMNQTTISQSKRIEQVTEQKTSDIKVLEQRMLELESLLEIQNTKVHNVESELERKTNQLSELRERHAAETHELAKQVADLNNSKASSEAQVRVLHVELEAKAEQVQRLEKSLAETRDVENKIAREKEELSSKLHRTELDVKEQERLLNELTKRNKRAKELEAEVCQLAKTRAALETKIRILEDERDEREKQVQLSAGRYSDQVVELQMEVEALTAAKSSLRAKLTAAEKAVEKSEEALRNANATHSADTSSLRQALADQIEAKAQLTTKIEELEAQLLVARRLSDDASERKSEVENLQNQFESASKENRSLKLRIGDIEQELERKEKQIKEVVNRYSQEVATLSDKLECQAKESHNLQKEIDQLQNGLGLSSEASNETKTLQERIASLEKAIDVERALTRDAEKAKKRVELELATVESSKTDLQERFEKVSSERNEVIAALEEVIHEVQSREDEIDALADALRRREDELEHARMIASKALSSAQEIKARYKDKSGSSFDIDRNSELEDQVASLTAALGQMKKNNSSLQRKLARLEEELTKKEGEYSELKVNFLNSSKTPSNGKMDQYVGRSPPGEPPACSFNENASTAASTTSGNTHVLDSPSRSIGFAESMSDVGASSDPWGIQPASTSSSDSSDNSVSFAGVRADPGDKKSMERNALRKYVRRRYMSAKAASSTN